MIFMKNTSFLGLLVIFLAFSFINCAGVPSINISSKINDEFVALQSDFLGTWLRSSDVFMAHTFSEDEHVGFNQNESYKAKIINWEYTINRGVNSNSYPAGFKITRIITESIGNWNHSIGDTTETIYFLSKDKNSITLSTRPDVIFLKQ
jgi:hypothetical protein